MDIRYLILDDREKRINFVNDIVYKNKNFVITIKANICGIDKNIKETNLILPYFLKKVLNEFDVVRYQKVNSYDGNYFIVEINEKDCFYIKSTLVNIEDSTLGRFIDLDLYTGLESSISRKDINVPRRKCIICDDDYSICIRENKHTQADIIETSKQLIKEGFVELLVSYTKKALVEEVRAYPKFGLVTSINSGKHIDMDYNTFLKSIDAIEPFLREYAYVGFNLSEESLLLLREIGIRAEKSMFNATNGVNTHKGIIFLLGFLLPSIVDYIYNSKNFNSIQNGIKLLSKDILNDFSHIEKKENLTNGEKIYLNYGITGIRGIIHNGLEISFNILKGTTFIDKNKIQLDKDEDLNELVIEILLLSMQEIDDTVILNKSDIETLNYVKKIASNILNIGGYKTSIGKVFIDKFTQECIRMNISPGGSADIVTTVLLLHIVRQEFEVN